MARDELDLGGWFILRMGSTDTLSVCRWLRARGFNVWTPVDRKVGRMPRTRTRYDKEFALMPSYAFASMEGFDELARLANVPSSDTPNFTLFRYQGGYPLVADDQLDALRSEEDRRKGIFERLRRRGMKGPTFGKGEAVHMQEGGFQGLSGIVEDMQGKYALVSFPGFHSPIKIASLLLGRDVQCEESSIAADEAA